ncbi:MAG: hypothetical protein RSE23_01875 [Clostridia bacterium]
MGVILTPAEQLQKLQQENERLRNENNCFTEIVAKLEYQACLTELGLTDAEMEAEAVMVDTQQEVMK